MQNVYAKRIYNHISSLRVNILYIARIFLNKQIEICKTSQNFVEPFQSLITLKFFCLSLDVYCLSSSVLIP